jgi:tetratricopeptide (TPR) repeat protein
LSFIRRILSGSRLRELRQEVAESPGPRSYCALAAEHARLGEMVEAERVAREGLELFPGNSELQRLAERSSAIEAEGRTRELYRELRDAPRPAVWRELCEILLDGGRLARAEECAQEWFAATGDGNALLARGEARSERFFIDRRRDDARLALDLIDGAEKALLRDSRPLRLKLNLFSRVGAWKEARRTVGQLLELEPGDAVLEARFRTLTSVLDTAPTLEQALREVERSGHLIDENRPVQEGPTASGEIRPVLKRMCNEPGVRAAIYVRGSTALVQGPRGATAERTARAVREVVQKSRTAARRLGLGQAHEVTLEGDFGQLLVVPGDLGAAALWYARSLSDRTRQELVELTALTGDSPQDSDE